MDPNVDTGGLSALNDDVLIYLFSCLSVHEILALRQTCSRFHQASTARAIWLASYNQDISANHFPFPSVPLDSLDAAELEKAVKRSYALGCEYWMSQQPKPRRTRIGSPSSNPVALVKLLPGGDRFLALTIGIWPKIIVYDIHDGWTKIAEWERGCDIMNNGGILVNAVANASVTLAVACSINQIPQIVLLSLTQTDKFPACLESVGAISGSWTDRPLALDGHLLAYGDDQLRVGIHDVQEGTSAVLQSPEEHRHPDRSLQVVFAHESILVARARSIHLFPYPTLRVTEEGSEEHVYFPLASYSFGWIESISIAPSPPADSSYGALSILVRTTAENPWAPEDVSLALYELAVNPAYKTRSSAKDDDETEEGDTPYVFPPTLSSTVPCISGHLRCSDIILGRFGTAVWINPKDRSAAGLVSPEVLLAPRTSECLTGVVFPRNFGEALVRKRDSELEKENPVRIPKKLHANLLDDWLSFDYSEEKARIVVGSAVGKILVLDL